jgi:hypothetical protein
VRPVAEVYWEREFNRTETWSALVGAIWNFRDWMVFDVGLRAARLNGLPIEEVRLGLTWTIPVWASAESG